MTTVDIAAPASDRALPGAPLLEATGLEHYFGRLHVLRRMDLTIARGEIVALLGPSGCGKTTLLRLLAGLLEPTAGRLARSPEARQSGFVFQRPVLLPWRTSLENVLLPIEIHRRVRHEDRERARDVVRLVGLSGFEEARPAALSGGMQQRVALARALIEYPRILFLDEPFSALDELTREEMNLELLRVFETEAEVQAAVMVTHSLEEAAFLADRVLVFSGRPGTLLDAVPVPLARPRTIEQKDSEGFHACIARLRRLLRSRA